MNIHTVGYNGASPVIRKQELSSTGTRKEVPVEVKILTAHSLLQCFRTFLTEN